VPRIVWTESAWQEVECAASFIERDSPRYAAALVAQARDAARSLSKFPSRGSIVPEVSTSSVREIFVKSYRLIYEVEPNRVVILAFIHGARQFPRDLLE
jgi:plasmid stabilization system protein ParE